jgi:hypothetical protein
MDVGENSRMMVLLKLEGRQNQRKVVVELVLEVEVGGSDCEAQDQRDEETWHLMKGKHLLRPLMKW